MNLSKKRKTIIITYLTKLTSIIVSIRHTLQTIQLQLIQNISSLKDYNRDNRVNDNIPIKMNFDTTVCADFWR